MTIKEAVLSTCAVLVDPGAVDVEIINAELNAGDNYTKNHQSQVAKIACAVLSATLSISSLKEGDLQVTYNADGIKSRLSYLSQLHGFTEFQGEVPNISAPKLW